MHFYPSAGIAVVWFLCIVWMGFWVTDKIPCWSAWHQLLSPSVGWWSVVPSKQQYLWLTLLIYLQQIFTPRQTCWGSNLTVSGSDELDELDGAGRCSVSSIWSINTPSGALGAAQYWAQCLSSISSTVVHLWIFKVEGKFPLLEVASSARRDYVQFAWNVPGKGPKLLALLEHYRCYCTLSLCWAVYLCLYKLS